MFSKKEMDVLQQVAFFQLKKTATQKIIHQLNDLKAHIQHSKIHQSFDYPIEMDTTLGKISKGENYKGLPYLILDFPRIFSQRGIFAFRTMFWWGNGCFATLHLSGKYLNVDKKEWRSAFEDLQQRDLFFYKNEQDEWLHEVDAVNFVPVSSLEWHDFEKWLAQNDFIKIAAKLDIENIEQLPQFGLNTFNELFQWLSSIQSFSASR